MDGNDWEGILRVPGSVTKLTQQDSFWLRAGQGKQTSTGNEEFDQISPMNRKRGWGILSKMTQQDSCYSWVIQAWLGQTPRLRSRRFREVWLKFSQGRSCVNVYQKKKKLQELISKFRKFAGHKINVQKSTNYTLRDSNL